MKHIQVGTRVKHAYETSKIPFAQWIWRNHVPVVAKKAFELSKKYQANEDISVSSAWLHDFGDAFVGRHDSQFDQITNQKSTVILQQVGFSKKQIDLIVHKIIPPHSCKNDAFPTTLEGKILATADAWAHLMTDFYPQMCFKNIPQNHKFDKWIEWLQEKIERDYSKKIFFKEEKQQVTHRYSCLKESFKMIELDHQSI